MASESILPILRPESPAPADAKPKRSQFLEPEQVSAPEAARLVGVSSASWWRLSAAGKVPRPNRLGGRTLWQVNGPNGLREWIRQGCPSRSEFEARQVVHYRK